MDRQGFTLFVWPGMDQQWALVLHRFVKWIVHMLTGTCELQRILQGFDPSSPSPVMCMNTESSLKYSNQLTGVLADLRRRGITAEELLHRIVDTKHLNVAAPMFDIAFRPNLMTFYSEFERTVVINDIAVKFTREAYDSANIHHEAMLHELWALLQPNIRRSDRFTDVWGDIGFQGKDPATDFRGMGVLGLRCLVYFSKHHTRAARDTLLASKISDPQFPFAITGINMTSMIMEWLRGDQLNGVIYHYTRGLASIQPAYEKADDESRELIPLFELYCWLMTTFATHWVAAKPKTIMEFNVIRAQFKRHVETAKLRGISGPLRL